MLLKKKKKKRKVTQKNYKKRKKMEQKVLQYLKDCSKMLLMEKMMKIEKKNQP